MAQELEELRMEMQTMKGEILGAVEQVAVSVATLAGSVEEMRRDFDKRFQDLSQDVKYLLRINLGDGEKVGDIPKLSFGRKD